MVDRLAMTVPELARFHGVKADGFTYDYSATVYEGTAAALRLFAEELHFRGASFRWTWTTAIAVE